MPRKLDACIKYNWIRGQRLAYGCAVCSVSLLKGSDGCQTRRTDGLTCGADRCGEGVLLAGLPEPGLCTGCRSLRLFRVPRGSRYLVAWSSIDSTVAEQGAVSFSPYLGPRLLLPDSPCGRRHWARPRASDQPGRSTRGSARKVLAPNRARGRRPGPRRNAVRAPAGDRALRQPTLCLPPQFRHRK
jgi:hypothetical protein